MNGDNHALRTSQKFSCKYTLKPMACLNRTSKTGAAIAFHELMRFLVFAGMSIHTGIYDIRWLRQSKSRASTGGAIFLYENCLLKTRDSCGHCGKIALKSQPIA